MLAAEAAKLDEQGKSNSGISWEALLNLEAGADIDATAAAQYKDSTLFNSKLGNATSGDDVGSIPVGWVNQFGPAAALQHQNEIGSIGTSNWQNQNAYQQMTTILGGGIVPLLSEKIFC